ncbi:MAG: lactate utilization protein C [Burkholderiales bacterium]|nr:lactate utilization protein C [Burkholderiales bacterium]MBP6675984.1 lactate utilization protein C [Vitreoscilla sp.]
MALPDTSAARSRILGALRQGAPAQALPHPELTTYLAGPFGRGAQGQRVNPVDLLDIFENAARGWRADVLHADVVGWPLAVRAALDARSCQTVVTGAVSPLQPGLAEALQGLQVRVFNQALEAWKLEMFDTVDASVTSAQAGIADTGTLVLIPGMHEPRTLSLVPPVHVAVLMASQLYASLPAAMLALHPERDMPTNLVLITGPSKTSDIQQTLAFGAHGPKELVIVLVNDLAGQGSPA